MSSTEPRAERALGPIGDRVIFENEQIRVWIVRLGPGETQPWHRHYLPYLIIPLTPGRNEIHFEDGSVRRTDEAPGNVVWREPGEMHELRNSSDREYKNVLVEVKSPGAGDAAAHSG
jgi:quercetin dioxygenase-like cupin family protein